jgi:hypothetical protein
MKPFPCFLALLVATGAFAKAPPTFDPAADPAALARTFLDGDKVDALAGVKRIAIVGFRVEFGVENSAKAQSSGTTGWTASRSDIKLVGPTDADRQAIADQLYDRFVAGLTSLGFEVLPYDVVKQEKNYQSMQARFHKDYAPVGTQVGKSVFVGAHDMPIYFTNEDKHLGLGAAFSGGFTVQPQNIEAQIAKALDAAVVRATIDVQFADMKTSGGMFHSSSSIKTSEGLTIVPEMSKYYIVTPGSGKVRVELKETVAIASDAIDMKDVTTGKEKTEEGIGNALGVLLGSGGSHSTRHYEATATPDGYRSALDLYVGRYQDAALALVAAGTGRSFTPPPAPADPPAL